MTLERYYVYELRDPRTGKAFYRGKSTFGVTNRLKGHISEARSGHLPAKNDVIRSILADGLLPIEVKLFETDDSFEAFQYEWAMAYATCDATELANGFHYKPGYGGSFFKLNDIYRVYPRDEDGRYRYQVVGTTGSMYRLSALLRYTHLAIYASPERLNIILGERVLLKERMRQREIEIEESKRQWKDEQERKRIQAIAYARDRKITINDVKGLDVK